MAKKHRGGRRRYNPIVAIPFVASLALVTLADGDVAAADILSADLADDFFCVSLHGNWSLRDPTAGEGPISVGLAHGGLNAAEIEEHLEVVMTSRHDILERERARRPVRKVGIFLLRTADSAAHLNDGVIVKTKLLFMVGLPEPNIRFWAWNQSGGSLTTGAVLDLTGTLFGRWK